MELSGPLHHKQSTGLQRWLLITNQLPTVVPLEHRMGLMAAFTRPVRSAWQQYGTSHTEALSKDNIINDKTHVEAWPQRTWEISLKFKIEVIQ